MTSKFILCDIDGTLADCRWREHLIEENGWDAFHEASVNDEPIKPIMTLLNKEWGAVVIALTGRNERYRQITNQWLIIHGCGAIADLIMRPDNDFTKSPEMKVEQACKYFGCEPQNLKDFVALVIDNEEKITDKFNSLGITTLLMKEGVR